MTEIEKYCYSPCNNTISLLIYLLITFDFQERISLCIPGWVRTYGGPLVSASQSAGLTGMQYHVWLTIPFLKKIVMLIFQSRNSASLNQKKSPPLLIWDELPLIFMLFPYQPSHSVHPMGSPLTCWSGFIENSW